ncbi:MAG: alkaline phosphatase family protein [Candidatus Omnitrophica bacterium]|nr:alkaline phosphatase family protein [Candidatus Omnitrophota bacterium]
MKKDKVLVIGIDAFNQRVIDGLAEKLPNFKGLETYTKLETTIPPETPVAWSAASTGTNPGKYGIFDFVNRDPKTYLPKLNLAKEKGGMIKTQYTSAMKGIPFWRILSQNNIQSTVIRFPVTFPPEKVNGRMLSGLGTIDIKGMLNSYSFYTDEDCKLDSEGKIIKIDLYANTADTYISGAVIRKSHKIEYLKADMKITIEDKQTIIDVYGKKYAVKTKGWSDMVRVRFRIGFKNIYGICNAYLISTKPFRMYLSSVQIDPENQVVDITYPKDYGKELVKQIGMFHTLGIPEDTKAVTENKIDKSVFLEQVRHIEEERYKMFWYEFKRFKKGAFVFVFDSGDRLNHIFWKENEISKEIEDYYIEKDNFIGEVISKLDDNTALIVLSDHGFSNFKREVNINSWLVEEGYMKVNKNEGSLFKFVDWGNTKAYSLGFTSLYINKKGREGKGIVEDESLIDEIIIKLGKLKDNNKDVFTNIYKSKEIYNGRYIDTAPDIIIGFSDGYRMSWSNAVGGLDKEIIFDNTTKWKGDHLIDRTHVPGILFTNFKINTKNPDIIDVAPTILKLFNVPIPKNMEGMCLI